MKPPHPVRKVISPLVLANLYPSTAPPPKEVEAPPQLEDLDIVPADRVRLSHLVRESAEWGQQEKEAKKARKPITEQIKTILGAYKIGRVLVCGLWVNYYNAPRTTLDKGLLMTNLLEAGILPAKATKILEMSTVTKDSYTLRIRVPGESDDD